VIAPKRFKHRKEFRGRMKGKATRGNKVSYGEYGMQALEPTWITANQIEAARIAMTRYTKRGGSVWIKVFPNKPVTKKPAETRMGSGKGALDHWIAVVKPGRVLFEVGGVSEEMAREAIRLAGHKLPCKTKFIKREGDFVASHVRVRKTLLEPTAESAAAEDTADPTSAASSGDPAASNKETGGE